MKCTICRSGETAPGTATVTLERGTATVVFKAVPALVCQNCGEEYLDDRTTASLLLAAEAALAQGVQVDVRQYVAA
ncbi:MAG TPA: type II toxin-antitoxin system MqsA family antitoxin [Chloroflexota bacterium]|nr:type II toxin-antitoxin system MqsA family antitoxin [Chloroflexota bacterium]